MDLKNRRSIRFKPRKIGIQNFGNRFYNRNREAVSPRFGWIPLARLKICAVARFARIRTAAPPHRRTAAPIDLNFS